MTPATASTRADHKPDPPRPALRLVSPSAAQKTNELAPSEAVEREERRVKTWAVAAGVPLGIVVMPGLGLAGYLLGSSPLGAAIAAGVVVVAVVIALVLWLATHAHGVHCPGCPDC